MKKMLLMGAFLCSIFAVSGYSAEYQGRGYYQNQNNWNRGTAVGYQNGPVAGSCDQACPSDAPAGECYCKYVHYQPRYYTTQRCVEEQYTCPKRCCRYVPQYYQVQKCRYVPQYYCETYCRQVPEYYEVQECKTRQKVVCDQNVEYCPTYYWKRECQPCAPQSCAPAAPACSTCP